jgi:hypothetical protein
MHGEEYGFEHDSITRATSWTWSVAKGHQQHLMVGAVVWDEGYVAVHQEGVCAMLALSLPRIVNNQVDREDGSAR